MLISRSVFIKHIDSANQFISLFCQMLFSFLNNYSKRTFYE